jgi:hypothetical protein
VILLELPVANTTDVEGAMVDIDEDASVGVGFVEVGGIEEEDGFEDVDDDEVAAGADVEGGSVEVWDGSADADVLSVGLAAGELLLIKPKRSRLSIL